MASTSDKYHDELITMVLITIVLLLQIFLVSLKHMVKSSGQVIFKYEITNAIFTFNAMFYHHRVIRVDVYRNRV